MADNADKKITLGYTEPPKNFMEMDPQEQFEFCRQILRGINPNRQPEAKPAKKQRKGLLRRVRKS